MVRDADDAVCVCVSGERDSFFNFFLWIEAVIAAPRPPMIDRAG